MFTNVWINVTKPKFRICIIAAIWGFLTGLERAVIIPTLWLYFSNKFSPTTASQYYGWTLASFNVAILFCDPLFGYLAFMKIRVKILLVISNQLGIIGNVVYFTASYPWMILVGRLLAGAGAGCEVPLYADIVRITTIHERTPYIVTLLLCRQFGLIIGPACTLIMKGIKFRIGQVTFDVYNGPGLFLGILWAVHTLLVFLVYPQIDNENETSPLISSSSVENDSCHIMKEITEHKFQATTKDKISNFFNPANYREYCTYRILTILFIIFSSYFCLMALESVLPPMAAMYFQWSEVETSYVYVGCGLLVIIVYIVLRLISSHGAQDRLLILVGLLVLLVSYIWLSISLSLIEKNKPTLYIVLIINGIILHVFGQPFCVACSESLYTKMVSIADQDRAQSILRVFINLALLIGPFVGGSLESRANVVFILLSLTVILPMLLLVFKFHLFTYEEDDNDEQ